MRALFPSPHEQITFLQKTLRQVTLLAANSGGCNREVQSSTITENSYGHRRNEEVRTYSESFYGPFPEEAFTELRERRRQALEESLRT